MYGSRDRTGLSKLAIPVALVVIVAVAGAYVLLSRGSAPSTSIQSSSSSALPTVPVKDAVNQFIQDFNDRNVDGLVAFYAQSSTLVWSGHVGGLAGMYSPCGKH